MEYDKTITEILGIVIKTKFKSINAMSHQTGIPYMTISTVLKKGVENSLFRTIKRICDALKIRMDDVFDMQQEDTVGRKILELPNGYSITELKQLLMTCEVITENFDKPHLNEEINKLSKEYLLEIITDDILKTHHMLSKKMANDNP